MKWLPFATSVACFGGCLVACSNDDSNGGSPGDASPDTTATVDASGGSDAPIGDDGGPDVGTPKITVNSPVVYVGAPATLTETLTFAGDASTFAANGQWFLQDSPAQSTIPIHSILGTGPTITFVPDWPGTYVIQDSHPFGDGKGTIATTTVTAYVAPVFFARTILSSQGGTLDLHVLGQDGSGSHSAACTTSIDSSQAEQAKQRTLYTGASGLDWWEAPPGQTSRFVFASVTTLFATDAGYDVSLLAGQATDSCLTAPNKLLEISGALGALAQPRISPDGSRVAFLEPLGSSFQLATVSMDGSAHRTLAPIYAGGAAPDGGGDESSFVRVEWIDGGSIAFPRPNGDGTWSVMSITDAAGAAAKILCTASGSTPHHVVVRGDVVYAAYAPTSGAPVDLYSLVASTPGAACTGATNLTSVVGANSRAHDFALSPDGSQIALLVYDQATNGGGTDPNNEGALAVITLDGGAKQSIETLSPGRIGPRWIASGSRLVFTRAVPPSGDGGEAIYAEAVTVVQADGGGFYDLAVGNGSDTIVAGAGPGGSCAIARACGSPAHDEPRLFGGLAAIAALSVVSRRRRSR